MNIYLSRINGICFKDRNYCFKYSLFETNKNYRTTCSILDYFLDISHKQHEKQLILKKLRIEISLIAYGGNSKKCKCNANLTNFDHKIRVVLHFLMIK